MTLGALLAERGGAVIGRGAELAALRALFAADGPRVAVVHGLAGTGKTALLRAFRVDAAARGIRVVAVDGRAVEPTPHGFAEAAGTVRDGDLLVVDTAERLRLLDDWLRLTFLPSLPAGARVAIATRDAPGAAWRATFGELLRAVPLGPLAPADAAEVLHAAGLDEAQACWVNRFVRGHPLSLQLAASAVRERPEAPEDAVLPTVVQELAALYLDGLEPGTRELLDACSVLRRVTFSLLSALRPGEPPQDAFARLQALPFTELGREGLVIHDTVREAVAALLRATDPVRHRAYRTAAWRQIRAELAGASGAARWASLADMIALVDEPLVREAFFPSAVQHYAVEPAGGGDFAAIEAIAARHEPPAAVALLRDWAGALPEAFRVARGPRGDVVAFAAVTDLSRVPRRLLDRDPLCEAWRRDLRARPVDGVLVARDALAWGTGAAPSPCFSALLRDTERAWLEAGPRRVYSYTRGDDLLAQLAPLGYLPLGEPVDIGGAAHCPLVCDLGPESVAGWLSGLAARDLPVGATTLDTEARELRLDGRCISLSRLECDVLRYLMDREGRPVARDALLRDVWGYDWTGGSNVVDVAISGLRRKLGEHAGALETVRGVGYRLSALGAR